MAEDGSGDAARLTEAPPHGAGLTGDQASAWCRNLGAYAAVPPGAVEQVLAWRAAGLPADPPPELGSLVDDHVAPSTVAAYLAAGFELPAVAVLAHVELDVARRWRAAGLSPDQTWAVVRADPTLTPDELAAYGAEGVGWPDLVAWIGYGFDARQARRWRDLGLSATQARVWRSIGLGPADAEKHLAGGGGQVPSDLQVGWSARSTDPADRQYGVTDPPGTRGAAAAEPADLRDYLRWQP